MSTEKQPKEITNQEFELSEVLRIFADAADKMSFAQRLGKKYTARYCPYKKGDKLRVKPEYGPEETIEVSFVRFDEHGGVTGMAELCGLPLTKDGSKKRGRLAVWIRSNKEIIEKL